MASVPRWFFQCGEIRIVLHRAFTRLEFGERQIIFIPRQIAKSQRDVCGDEVRFLTKRFSQDRDGFLKAARPVKDISQLPMVWPHPRP